LATLEAWKLGEEKKLFIRTAPVRKRRNRLPTQQNASSPRRAGTVRSYMCQCYQKNVV